MKYFRQIKDVDWVNTPKGTVWVYDSHYLQPEDFELRTNLGVNPELIDDKDWIWESIPSIDIS